jgi:alkylhydroperoxidase family enzyme
MTPRIAPLEAPYDPDVAARLDQMMPKGMPPIALFRTFARNLPMCDAMADWGPYELSRRLSLTMRQREIAIDRTCARCGCEYEWGVHITFFADRVELTPAQITSLTHGGPDDPCWDDPAEQALIRVVDALHDTADVPDGLWAEIAGHLDQAQLLDLLVLVGWYHAISYVGRVARVPLEDGAARFADVAPEAAVDLTR